MKQYILLILNHYSHYTTTLYLLPEEKVTDEIWNYIVSLSRNKVLFLEANDRKYIPHLVELKKLIEDFEVPETYIRNKNIKDTTVISYVGSLGNRNF